MPPALTIEGFFFGESAPIKEKVSEIFLQLPTSEKFGRGVPKIVEAYGKDALRSGKTQTQRLFRTASSAVKRVIDAGILAQMENANRNRTFAYGEY